MPDTPSVALKVDVIYVFRNCETPRAKLKGDEELFYSLRSVQKYLTGYRRIFIIGDEPNFLQAPGVSCTCLLTKDPYKSKQHNVARKLLLACHESRIADSFVLFNDDFFLLKPLDVLHLPFYRSGTLKMHLEWQEPNREPGDPYMGAMKNTIRQLEAHGLPTTDFEVHTPIAFNKEILSVVLGDSFDWSSQWGLLYRSLYGNYLRIAGERMPGHDVKIGEDLTAPHIKQTVGDNAFLSTSPTGMNDAMAAFLADRFSGPAKKGLTPGIANPTLE